jgi:two-component system sensor histidine kinase KdpD
MVALGGGPEGEALIHRAARIAARSGGDLLAVCVTRPLHLTGAGRAALAAQRRLTESLGGSYHELTGDIPAALLAFAHACSATQLVIGGTRHAWLSALRSRTTIGTQVIRRGSGIDVHLVTCTPIANGAACGI